MKRLALSLFLLAMAVGLDLQAPQASASSPCPPGVPVCSRDKQCDDFCFVRGFGDCVQNCCTCLG